MTARARVRALSAEETVRSKHGECICGCGGNLPMESHWNYRTQRQEKQVKEGALYATGACRKRCYRRAVADGRRETEADRADRAAKEAITLEITQLRAQADADEERADEARARATAARQRAARLEREQAGQLRIDKTPPPLVDDVSDSPAMHGEAIRSPLYSHGGPVESAKERRKRHREGRTR